MTLPAGADQLHRGQQRPAAHRAGAGPHGLRTGRWLRMTGIRGCCTTGWLQWH